MMHIATPPTLPTLPTLPAPPDAPPPPPLAAELGDAIDAWVRRCGGRVNMTP